MTLYILYQLESKEKETRLTIIGVYNSKTDADDKLRKQIAYTKKYLQTSLGEQAFSKITIEEEAYPDIYVKFIQKNSFVEIGLKEKNGDI